MLKGTTFLYLTVATPSCAGIYCEGVLVERLVSEKKSSDALGELLILACERYTLDQIVYVNGPGSFMAIKIAYIFLKTIAMVKKIPFYAMEAFVFNGNNPIKAIGKLYFVRIADKIETRQFSEPLSVQFELPDVLQIDKIMHDAAPIYAIGAV